MSAPVFEQLSVGDVVAERAVLFTREGLVRYAGASLDLNPIHYNDAFAQQVGLPGVIAHGMLTMGAAASPVVGWLGSAGFVKDYQVRFTRPVPVSALEGAEVTTTATVAVIDEDARTARIDLKVVFADQTVLGKSQLVVAFA